MKQFAKNFIWAIVTLLSIAFVFSLLFQNAKEPEALGLNQVAQKINAGEVEKVEVAGDSLSIQLKGGTKFVSKKESGVGFVETIRSYGVEPVALQAVKVDIVEESGFKFWMAILIPALLPVLIIGIFMWMIMQQAKGSASQAFTFGKANIKLFSQFKDKVTFKDVAGVKEAKEELMEVVDFLKNPKKYLDLGAKIPRGVLLLGSPGTGKTLLARATAGESGVPFFHISGSEFVEMFVGVGASRVRDLFATAKKVGKSIIFIDEIDAVGRERGSGIGGGHDEREQTLNQILVEMDGFEKEDGRIVIAATNRPDVLDPALLRPGRFDRRIVLDLPDINDREEILKIHSEGKVLAKDINLRKIAERTSGFAGADLMNLMNEAAIWAARKNQKEINQIDIYSSIEKVLLGPERRGRALSQKEKETIAYHEAGHALVSASLKGSDPVSKVSIISRGRAGGYTLKQPLEESGLRTKAQFMNEIAILLAGYVAEQKQFGDISTGASNDLQIASDIARRLVTKYGMSTALGPTVFGKTEELSFLGREILAEKNYSEKVAAEIDSEIKAFISKGLDAAKKVLSVRGDVLEAIAQTLLEKETLEQDEFNEIINKFKFAHVSVKA